ncbi:hypothetical protein GLYMA_01G001150v4 [Glycine max]|nr:hypothetical protein GLYMA_01G001150v4 [Glycine max]KAH1160882.1 hypothetical protein GYH30_000012 [Glycine max]
MVSLSQKSWALQSHLFLFLLSSSLDTKLKPCKPMFFIFLQGSSLSYRS